MSLVPFYEYFCNTLGFQKEKEKVSGWWKVAKNTGFLLPYENVWFISERPCVLNRNKEGNLHSLTGPAIAYPDGWSIYAINGVTVPEFVIKNPEEITVALINEEDNVEIKRIMMNIYGEERYLKDSESILINEDVDHLGKRRKLYKALVTGDEPLGMVEVVNSSPEPDGSFKKYWLRVPPDIETAHEAVAWTFNEKPTEYEPIVET